MTDFYEVLCVVRGAQTDDIAQAYRRAAMTYNPECHKNVVGSERDELARKFRLVSQAYVVLSDPKLRAVYDMYGDDGVKHGGTGNVGVPGGLNIDDVDPDSVFRKFFGVDSPFSVLGDISGLQNNQHNFYSNAARVDRHPPQLPPTKLDLHITLDDVFFGCLKKVTYPKRRLSSNGEVMEETMVTQEVNIPRGVEDGSVLKMEKKGDVQDGRTAGDVYVAMTQVAHPSYTRNGNDLQTIVNISLTDALCGVSIDLNLIDGRKLNVFVDEVVSEGYTRVIPNEGMPLADCTEKRGNLIIRCKTTFPKYLTAEQRSELKRILNQNA